MRIIAYASLGPCYSFVRPNNVRGFLFFIFFYYIIAEIVRTKNRFQNYFQNYKTLIYVAQVGQCCFVSLYMTRIFTVNIND